MCEVCASQEGGREGRGGGSREKERGRGEREREKKRGKDTCTRRMSIPCGVCLLRPNNAMQVFLFTLLIYFVRAEREHSTS
jgi:hypothetical protein